MLAIHTPKPVSAGRSLPSKPRALRHGGGEQLSSFPPTCTGEPLRRGSRPQIVRVGWLVFYFHGGCSACYGFFGKFTFKRASLRCELPCPPPPRPPPPTPTPGLPVWNPRGWGHLEVNTSNPFTCCPSSAAPLHPLPLLQPRARRGSAPKKPRAPRWLPSGPAKVSCEGIAQQSCRMPPWRLLFPTAGIYCRSPLPKALGGGLIQLESWHMGYRSPKTGNVPGPSPVGLVRWERCLAGRWDLSPAAPQPLGAHPYPLAAPQERCQPGGQPAGRLPCPGLPRSPCLPTPPARAAWPWHGCGSSPCGSSPRRSFPRYPARAPLAMAQVPAFLSQPRRGSPLTPGSSSTSDAASSFSPSVAHQSLLLPNCCAIRRVSHTPSFWT